MWRIKVGMGFGKGLSPLPSKFLSFFRLETVYPSAFFMRKACNSGMLSPQTEQFCFVFKHCVVLHPLQPAGYAYELFGFGFVVHSLRFTPIMCAIHRKLFPDNRFDFLCCYTVRSITHF